MYRISGGVSKLLEFLVILVAHQWTVPRTLVDQVWASQTFSVHQARRGPAKKHVAAALISSLPSLRLIQSKEVGEKIRVTRNKVRNPVTRTSRFAVGGRKRTRCGGCPSDTA